MLNFFVKDDPVLKVQKEEALSIAREIVALGEHSGWPHFVKAIEALAKTYTPMVERVTGPDHAVQIASQVAVASGLRKAIGLMEQQKENLKSLSK